MKIRILNSVICCAAFRVEIADLKIEKKNTSSSIDVLAFGVEDLPLNMKYNI